MMACGARSRFCGFRLGGRSFWLQITLSHRRCRKIERPIPLALPDVTHRTLAEFSPNPGALCLDLRLYFLQKTWKGCTFLPSGLLDGVGPCICMRPFY